MCVGGRGQKQARRGLMSTLIRLASSISSSYNSEDHSFCDINLEDIYTGHMISSIKIPLLAKTSSIFYSIPGRRIIDERAPIAPITTPKEVVKSGTMDEIDKYVHANSQLPSSPEITPQEREGSDQEQEIRQASQLLLMAVRGSQDSEYGGDEKLRRALTVHSLARIICAAMPVDLTEAEACEILSVLPPEVFDSYPSNMSPEPYIPRNKLEEIVVALVRAFFIGLKTAAPYTKQIILALMREERKYKISEKVVAAGLGTIETLCGSTVGRALVSSSQGVAGSVLRGVSQGMAVIMVDIQDSPPSPPSRFQPRRR